MSEPKYPVTVATAVGDAMAAPMCLVICYICSSAYFCSPDGAVEFVIFFIAVVIAWFIVIMMCFSPAADTVAASFCKFTFLTLPL